MSRLVFDKLADKIKALNVINYEHTKFRDCISIEERLSVYLYRIGHNVCHTTISDMFGIGKSTSIKICNEIRDCIC